MKKTTKNKYGQYFTPELIAEFMVSLANITTNAAILEPSCGEGIFLKVLQQCGFHNLAAYEVDRSLAQAYDFVKYESFVTANIAQSYDLIIGNPPYIRWKNLEQELKDELANHPLWTQYFNSLCDYLYIFILKSIELLKPNGQLIFICPEYWMNTQHSQSLRDYMMAHGFFEAIYHFNETPIFNKATVSVVVFKYVKSAQAQKPPVSITKYLRNQAITPEIMASIKNQDTRVKGIQTFEVKQFEIGKRWLLTTEATQASMAQLERACAKKNSPSPTTDTYHTIKDICDIGNGMVSGLDKAFQLADEPLTDAEQLATIQVIKAKDLKPFTFEKATPYIFANDVTHEEVLAKDYPNFFAKLSQVRDKLEGRYDYHRVIHFWQWVFLRNYRLFSSSKPRIFVPCKERISNKDYFRFALVEADYYPTQDVTGIFLKTGVKESIEYVLAFLNHPRVFEWLKNKGVVKGSIVEFSEKPIASIPFRKINWQNTNEAALHQQITQQVKAYIKHPKTALVEEIRQLIDGLLQL